MKFTEPFWIAGPWPGWIATSSRPRGGDWLDDEVNAWRSAGVTWLTNPVNARLRKSSFIRYPFLFVTHFYSLPIADRNIPDDDRAAVRLLHQIANELKNGRNALIHCRQGVGRAGMIAAALLIDSGADPQQAVDRVSVARSVAVPETQQQKMWLDSFAAALFRKS